MNSNYNITAEQSVLSYLLFNPQKIGEYKKDIKVETFFPLTHQKIYSTILELHEEDKAIDEEIIKKRLVKKHEFDEQVMLAILSNMSNNYIAKYIKELQELHIK